MRLFFVNFAAVYRQLRDSNSQWHKKNNCKKVPVWGTASWGECCWGSFTSGKSQLGEMPVGIYKLDIHLNSSDRMFMHENQTIKMFKRSLGQNHGSVKLFRISPLNRLKPFYFLNFMKILVEFFVRFKWL